MSALGYGLAVSQAALDALAASIPTPAAAAPPAVTDTSVKGAATSQFALSDHTHQGNVQAQRVQVVGTTGTATWTFSTAFDAVPVGSAHAETPTGMSYVNIASIVEGSVTKTGMQIQVVQVAKSVTLPTLALSLLGLVISLFGVAPAGVYVNCFARKPV